MKKILVIGGSGYVGKNLGLTIPNKYLLKTYYNKKNSNCVFFDLCNSKLDDIDIDYNKYSHVIIAAGMVKFSEIRDYPVESSRINVDCTKELVDEIVKKELVPVFISSESVFDGHNGNYSESHEPNPVFEYGRQKYDVEQYIKKITSNYLIIRLSKVFDSIVGGESLIMDWLTKIGKNEDIFCADDHVFTPIHIDDVIIYIEKLIKINAIGVFHASSMTPYSRDAMLEMVIERYNIYKDYNGSIVKQSLHSFKGASEIPLNTSMNPSKIINTTKIYPRSFLQWVDILTTKFINNMKSFND
jgi:dTDP-4-dehydrorhamnose reductase